MNKHELFPSFFRLAKGLRAKIIEFNKGEYSEDITKEGNVPLEDANLVTSKIGDTNLHRVVLDLDMDAALIPSSTPGHHHLIIDVAMTQGQYFTLLEALRDAEIIEDGYYAASKAKGYTAIRTPWTKKKPTPQPSPITQGIMWGEWTA